MCSEMELEAGNTFFRKKGINKFTWQRTDNGRLVERAMMDYVLVEKCVLGRLVFPAPSLCPLLVASYDTRGTRWLQF